MIRTEFYPPSYKFERLGTELFIVHRPTGRVLTQPTHNRDSCGRIIGMIPDGLELKEITKLNGQLHALKFTKAERREKLKELLMKKEESKNDIYNL